MSKKLLGKIQVWFEYNTLNPHFEGLTLEQTMNNIRKGLSLQS